MSDVEVDPRMAKGEQSSLLHRADCLAGHPPEAGKSCVWCAERKSRRERVEAWPVSSSARSA
jgi:hypothetical protein